MTNDKEFAIDGRLLKINQVMEIAGLGKTMIYRKVREGTFPRPCKPGCAFPRWSEREKRVWPHDDRRQA